MTYSTRSSSLSSNILWPPLRDSTAETGNKLQSYCECWCAGKTEIDGTVEIRLTTNAYTKTLHWPAHASTPMCKSCTVRMYGHSLIGTFIIVTLNYSSVPDYIDPRNVLGCVYAPMCAWVCVSRQIFMARPQSLNRYFSAL